MQERNPGKHDFCQYLFEMAPKTLWRFSSFLFCKWFLTEALSWIPSQNNLETVKMGCRVIKASCVLCLNGHGNSGRHQNQSYIPQAELLLMAKRLSHPLTTNQSEIGSSKKASLIKSLAFTADCPRPSLQCFLLVDRTSILFEFKAVERVIRVLSKGLFCQRNCNSQLISDSTLQTKKRRNEMNSITFIRQAISETWTVQIIGFLNTQSWNSWCVHKKSGEMWTIYSTTHKIFEEMFFWVSQLMPWRCLGSAWIKRIFFLQVNQLKCSVTSLLPALGQSTPSTW